jgi:hypothetical protein
MKSWMETNIPSLLGLQQLIHFCDRLHPEDGKFSFWIAAGIPPTAGRWASGKKEE